jgi:hypothetical protein
MSDQVAIALPETLRPWREWLSWFDPELALELGPLLHRLHPLLGAFRGNNQGGEPELEGLDDLRARGTYDHLLATEWLLADEVPDEFLRRAASGEHMFLAPRPRARRADRSIVALFDVGPLQFGAPRLAHIAMWILLARRARQAGGEFRWGALQSPGALFEGHATEHLKALLHGRTFASVHPDTFTQWRALFDENAAGGERWLIGSSFTESISGSSFTHRLSLQRDLQGRSLEVSLVERGNQRGLQLPLPEATSAAPLLRGAFKRGVTPQHHDSDPRAVALMRPPVISIDGSRVAVTLRDEAAALVYLVPRSEKEGGKDKPPAPRLHRWSSGYSALAMSFLGKRIGLLLADADKLRFWGTSLSLEPFPPQDVFHAPGSTAAWLPAAWMKEGKAQRVCVIDQSRRLLCWDSVAPDALRLEAQNVLGFAQINKNLLVYAYLSGGHVWIHRLNALGTRQQEPRSLSAAPNDTEVLFGGRACAVRLESEPAETWLVSTWGDTREAAATRAQLPAGARAIGLWRGVGNKDTALISLDRVNVRLHFINGINELLYTAPARIVSYTVCQGTGLVALLTERRQLVVASAATRDVRLIAQTGRDPHESA